MSWNGSRVALTQRKAAADYSGVGVVNGDYKIKMESSSEVKIQPSENKVFKDKLRSLVDFVCLRTPLFSPFFSIFTQSSWPRCIHDAFGAFPDMRWSMCAFSAPEVWMVVGILIIPPRFALPHQSTPSYFLKKCVRKYARQFLTITGVDLNIKIPCFLAF